MTTPRIPLVLLDHTELLRTVRQSIALPCFRSALNVPGLFMCLPEGRRRQFKGKPILPTLVLQTDSSLCLNLKGATHHPEPNTAYITVICCLLRMTHKLSLITSRINHHTTLEIQHEPPDTLDRSRKKCVSSSTAYGIHFPGMLLVRL
jgi:hypothetical protein